MGTFTEDHVKLPVLGSTDSVMSCATVWAAALSPPASQVGTARAETPPSVKVSLGVNVLVDEEDEEES